MPPSPTSSIQVNELAPQNVTLTVTFDGQRFDCGSYLTRAAAMQAARLFVQRKEQEAVNQRHHPRRKKKGTSP